MPRLSKTGKNRLPALKERIFVSNRDYVYGELNQSMMMGLFIPRQTLKL